MVYLTDAERLEAIAACDRILAANERLQAIVAELKESQRQMAAMWAPQEKRP